MYVLAALAGLTDVNAIALSMAESAKSGDASVAVNAIVIAAVTNTIVKCGMVVTLGGRRNLQSLWRRRQFWQPASA